MLSNLFPKFRLLFLPVFLLGSTLALLLTGGYWLVTDYWPLFDPSENQRLFVLFGLSILGLGPVLYRRFQLLGRGSDDRWITLFYMLPIALVGSTALNGLNVLRASTGRMVHLTTIGQIWQQPADVRYFTLRTYHLNRRDAGLGTAISVSGKHDERLDFAAYVVCPLLGTLADTAQVPAWLGLRYTYSISNRMPEPQKQKEWRAFLQRTQEDFNQLEPAGFSYLTRAGGLDYGREFQRAVQQSPQAAAGAAAVVLRPETTPFATRAAAPWRHLRWTFLLGWSGYLLMLLFPRLNATAVEGWQRGRTAPGPWQQARQFLRDNPHLRATPLLVALNVLVYLVMVVQLGDLGFRASDLRAWGGTSWPLVQAGEYWRLLTPMFLHGGLLHIIYNMIGLALIGYMWEPRLGTGRFALAYVLTGLSGVAASLWWAPTVVSVGASGAIFGLLGVVLGMLRQTPPAERAMHVLLVVVFGLPGLLMGFFSATTDNAGHLGGLLGGILLGLLWQPRPDDGYPAA